MCIFLYFSSFSGFLDSVSILAILNGAEMNTSVQISFQLSVFVFLGQILLKYHWSLDLLDFLKAAFKGAIKYFAAGNISIIHFFPNGKNMYDSDMCFFGHEMRLLGKCT